MKMILTLAALLALSGSAFAADGNVSSARLARLGFGNMKVMSDSQGHNVRGMGFAAVAGVSYATSPYSASYNGYLAVSHTHGAFAAGAAGSLAGFQGVNSYAIGGSVAYAK